MYCVCWGQAVGKEGWILDALYQARIRMQVTIYRRLRIGLDGYLDQSDAYYIS